MREELEQRLSAFASSSRAFTRAWFPVSRDVSCIGAVCVFVPLSVHYMEVYSMFCVFAVSFPRNTFVRLMFEKCVGELNFF